MVVVGIMFFTPAQEGVTTCCAMNLDFLKARIEGQVVLGLLQYLEGGPQVLGRYVTGDGQSG